MSRAELIYPLRRNLGKQLALLESDPHNKETLARYYKVRSTKVGLATIVIDFVRLNEMSRMLNKKFEDATVQDIEDLVFRINQKHTHPNSQNKYRKIIKSFYPWLKGCSKRENRGPHRLILRPAPANVHWRIRRKNSSRLVSE